MRVTRTAWTGAWLTAALALAACGGDATGPDQQSEAQKAQLLSELAGGYASAGAADLAGLIGRLSPGGVPLTPRSDSPFNVTTTLHFYDAAGAEQSHYDASATARVVADQRVTGSLVTKSPTSNVTTTIDRSATLAISGLAGAEQTRTLDGGSTGTVTEDVQSAQGTVHLVIKGTDHIEGLVLPVPMRAGVYPLSGAVSSQQDVQMSFPGGQEHLTIGARLVFDGSSVAKVTISGLTPSATECLLALDTYSLSCPGMGF